MSFNPDLCYDCGTTEEHILEFDSNDNYFIWACPPSAIQEN